MFEQTFVNANPRARKPWTLAVSLSLQTGLVALAVILPMLHPEMLHPKLEVPVYLPLLPKPKQPQPVAPQTNQTPAKTTHVFVPAPLTAPTRVPSQILMIADAPDFANLPLTGSFSGSVAVLPGVFSSLTGAPPPKPEPVARPDLPKGPVHVSSGVQSAALLLGPKPSYPQLARAARVQGTVRLQAVISADGAIRNLQVIAGPPLLVNAALEAVRQWRYRPTLLNGVAVEVITEIDVNFTLSQ